MMHRFRCASLLLLALCAACSTPKDESAPKPVAKTMPAALAAFLDYRPDLYPKDSTSSLSPAPGQSTRWPSAANAPKTDGRWARPAPIGNDELLLFDQGLDRVRRVDLHDGRVIEYTLQPGTPANANPDHVYPAAIATHDGLWIVDTSARLYDRSGKRLAEISVGLSPRSDAWLLALDDGSVLVFGHDAQGARTDRVERIAREGDGYTIHALTDVPGEATADASGQAGARSNPARVRLADGRVMISGGLHPLGAYSTEPSAQTWLFDPHTKQWQRSGDMATARANHALIALPDGGAIAAGDDSGRVERWNAQTGRWSALPDLPLPMNALHSVLGCGCQHPDGVALADGTVVIAGAFHAWLFALKPGDAHWRAVAHLDQPRPGATVQAIGKDLLALSGGNAYDGRLAGITFTRLALDGPMPGYGVAWSMHDAAIARRGDRVFAAGGWVESMSEGTPYPRYSAVAEVVGVDGTHGGLASIAALPHATGLARAAWLDDDRVVIKGVAIANDERSREHIDAPYTKPNASLLAVYSRHDAHWREIADARLDGAYLAGHVGDTGYFVAPDAHFLNVDLASGAVAALPNMIRTRSRFVARVLGDGQVVVAGGLAQAAVISAWDASCPDCADRLVGFGPEDRATVADVFDPKTSTWRETASATHAAVSTTILEDGRIAQIGGEYDVHGACMSVAIEVADRDGRAWRKLPLPGSLSVDALPSSRLLSPQDDGSPLANVLFLLVHTPASHRYALWRFVDAGEYWMQAGEGDERDLEGSLALPSIEQEPRYRISGLLHDQVLAWVDPRTR